MGLPREVRATCLAGPHLPPKKSLEIHEKTVAKLKSDPSHLSDPRFLSKCLVHFTLTFLGGPSAWYFWTRWRSPQEVLSNLSAGARLDGSSRKPIDLDRFSFHRFFLGVGFKMSSPLKPTSETDFYQSVSLVQIKT